MCCAIRVMVEERGKEGTGKEGKANSHEGCPGEGAGMLHKWEMWLGSFMGLVGSS